MSDRTKRQQFIQKATKHREALETLATELPEVKSAIQTHKLKRVIQPRPHSHDDCSYCAEGHSRHRHTFLDRELRVSNPETDYVRVYAKHSAVAAVIALRMIRDARESVRRVTQTQLSLLLAEARETYPQAELTGQWALNVLAEANLSFAIKLADIRSRCLPAYVVEPVIRAAFQLVRQASDLDTFLTESGYEMPVADSPVKAAQLYGIAA